MAAALLLLGALHSAAASPAQPLGAASSDLGDAWPAPPPHAAPCSEVSSSIGSDMVLQRAPEQAVIFGHACGKLATAKTVSVSLDGGKPLSAPLRPEAPWQVTLPPTPASHTPHTLRVSGGGFDVTYTNILFGDVILCSGQSNMCFSTNQMSGASAEIALADEPRFRSIRLFTVTPTHATKPATDVTVMQPWSVANSSSVGGGAANKSFSYFSAACWLQGRHLYDRLGGQVPLGLLTSAVGGTRIHCWSSAEALHECPQYLNGTTSPTDSNLWNTMIAPLLPMRFRFMVWLQSESDVCASDSQCAPQRGAKYYACAIQAMVKDWRAKFRAILPFLWVQISPWEGHEAATTANQLPDMRIAQMAANDLPLTGMATAVDLGPNATKDGWDTGDEHGPDPWGNVHFRNKGPLGPRLSAAAMNIVYKNRSVPYRGPEAASASRVADAALGCNGEPLAGVAVSFKPETLGGGLEWQERQCTRNSR